MTDNTSTVTIELTSTRERLGSDKDTVAVARLWFFDHVDREHHLDGTLIKSDAPLRLWFIDVGEQVARFAALDLPPEEISLRFVVASVHPETTSTTSFTV